MTAPNLTAPQNLEAEASVLGSILVDGDRFNDVAILLTPGDFYLHTYGAIFGAMLSLNDAGEQITIVTIDELLKRRGIDIPASKLAELAEHAQPGVKEHAGIIIRKARDRDLLRRLVETEDAMRNGGPSPELLDSLEAAIARLKSDAVQLGGPSSARSPITIKIADVEREEVTWLWKDRIPTGKLTLIEGDPGLGKSWLCLAISAADIEYSGR